jgi:hypothetical protein
MALPYWPEPTFAVVEHQGAVLTDMRAVHQDAAVACLTHNVALDQEPAGVARENRHVGDLVHGVAGDRALHAVEQQAVSAGVADFAIDDADVVALAEIGSGPGSPGSVCDRRRGSDWRGDVVGGTSGEQRLSAGEDQPCGAAHADDLGAGWQQQVALTGP